jgi:hypothetical protein
MSRTDGACYREQVQIPTPATVRSLLGIRRVTFHCGDSTSHPGLVCPPSTGVGSSG